MSVIPTVTSRRDEAIAADADICAPRGNITPLSSKLRVLITAMFAVLPIVRWEPAPIDILAPLVIVFLVTGAAANASSPRLNILFATCLYAIACIGIFTIGRSPDPQVSLRYHAITFLVFALGISAHLLFQDLSLALLAVRGIAIGFLLLLPILLFAYFVETPLLGITVTTGDLRFSGLSKNPNSFGLTLSLPLAIVVLDILGVHGESFTKFSRIVLWGFLGIIIASVVLTFSRNALLTSAITVAVIFLLIPKRRVRRFSMVSFPAVIVTFMLAAYTFAPNTGVRYLLGKIAASDGQNPRVTHQEEVLAGTISGDSPLFGSGPVSASLDYGLGAHNAYLTQLHDYGIFGLLALLILLGGAAIASISVARHASDSQVARIAIVIASLLLAQMMAGFFMDFLHQRHIWILVGAGWAMPYLNQNTKVLRE